MLNNFAAYYSKQTVAGESTHTSVSYGRTPTIAVQASVEPRVGQ